MEKSTPSLFETLQKGTDQDIMGAREDIELAQNLLSSTTVYQIDGWPSKKEEYGINYLVYYDDFPPLDNLYVYRPELEKVSNK